MNPPFVERTDKGRKGGWKYLCYDIWAKVIEVFPEAKVCACMIRGCNQKKGGYTQIIDIEKFEGVSIDTSIFIKEPGKNPLKIIKKYEANGKYKWIEEHEIKKGVSLRNIVSGRLKSGQKVPSGFLGISELSIKNFSMFLPGEIPTSRNGKPLGMVELLKTSNPENLKEYLKNVQNNLFKEFLQFGDKNILCGFDKCVKIPKNCL